MKVKDLVEVVNSLAETLGEDADVCVNLITRREINMLLHAMNIQLNIPTDDILWYLDNKYQGVADFNAVEKVLRDIAMGNLVIVRDDN